MIKSFTFSVAPTSVNKQKTPIIRKGRAQLIKTLEYRTWIKLSCQEMMPQRGFDGVFVWRCLILVPPSMTGADIDNIPKALIDVLVKCGKVPDDRYLADMRIRWALGSKIIVTVRREDFSKWAKIKKYSKSLIKKLSQPSLL